MFITYIDDSGSSDHNDLSKFYVITGIIINKDVLKNIKPAVLNYKIDNFVEEYIDAEIHTHDINKNRGEFANISRAKKDDLLTKLYELVNSLNITICSVIVDKELFKKSHPTWNLFDTAWLHLFKKCDEYIENINGVNERMILKIDQSSHKQQKKILDTFHTIRNGGLILQHPDAITHDPVFVNSAVVEGIQVADVIAYCIYQHRSGSKSFGLYWDGISDKFKKMKTNAGYNGIQELPKR